MFVMTVAGIFESKLNFVYSGTEKMVIGRVFHDKVQHILNYKTDEC